MPDITITIPTNQATRVLDGFCKQHNYLDIIPNTESISDFATRTGSRDGYQETIPNPETKMQFSKRKIREFIKESVRASEVSDAVGVASTTVSQSVEGDISLM